MLHRRQIAIAFVALLCDAVAIALLLHWLGRTDWLFGHTSGPASAVMASFWAASAGVIATGVWLALTVSRRRSTTAALRQLQTEKPEPSRAWLIAESVALALGFIPVMFIVISVGANLSRVSHQAQARHIKSGMASVDELAAGLNSDDYSTRFWAAQELKKMGPSAKLAVPALAKTLDEPRLAADAAQALAAIGPDAEPAISALVETIKREQHNRHVVDGAEGPSVLSWLAGRALTKIGPTSIPEFIALLDHDSRYVQMTAADALGNLGPAAKSALPALKRLLDNENEPLRHRARIAVERIEGRRPVSPI